MKCPNCEYDEHEEESKEEWESDTGGFYELESTMARPSPYTYLPSEDRTQLYACPKCKMAFIA